MLNPKKVTEMVFRQSLLILVLLGEQQLEIWTSSCIQPHSRVGILAVVAKGGYHSIARYEWEYNGAVAKKELYPILYATQCGCYSCSVKIYQQSFTFSFIVEGIIGLVTDRIMQYRLNRIR